MAKVDKKFGFIPNDMVQVIDEDNMNEHAEKPSESEDSGFLDDLKRKLDSIKLPIGAIHKGNHWSFHADNWTKEDFLKAIFSMPASIAYYLKTISKESQGDSLVEEGLISLITGIEMAINAFESLGIKKYREESVKLFHAVCDATEEFIKEAKKSADETMGV